MQILKYVAIILVIVVVVFAATRVLAAEPVSGTSFQVASNDTMSREEIRNKWRKARMEAARKHKSE